MKPAAVGHLAAGVLGNKALALRKLSGVSIADAVTRFGFSANFVGTTNEEILLWAGTTLKVISRIECELAHSANEHIFECIFVMGSHSTNLP